MRDDVGEVVVINCINKCVSLLTAEKNCQINIHFVLELELDQFDQRIKLVTISEIKSWLGKLILILSSTLN